VSVARAVGHRLTRAVLWLGIGAVAVVWMGVGALGVRAATREALARGGLIGADGTVVIADCRTETVDVETNTRLVDCTGTFTAADGSTPARQVVVEGTDGELSPGTRVSAHVVDGTAYQPSWVQCAVVAAIALFVALLGGLPLIPIALVLFYRVAGDDAQLPDGSGFVALLAIAVVGESTVTYLLYFA